MGCTLALYALVVLLAFILKVKRFLACGSKEVERPFPVYPRGKSRGGRVPPTPKHAARQHTTLAHIMLSAPPTRGLRPLVDPPGCSCCYCRHHAAIIHAGTALASSGDAD